MPGSTPVVQHMNIQLRPGQRCLLIGANGAGKTTLLKTLAGQHMVPEESIRVLGRPPFHDTKLTASGDLSYLGGNWVRDIAFAGYSIPLQVLAAESCTNSSARSKLTTCAMLLLACCTARQLCTRAVSGCVGHAMWHCARPGPLLTTCSACLTCFSLPCTPLKCTDRTLCNPTPQPSPTGPNISLSICPAASAKLVTSLTLQGDFPAAKMIDGLHGVDPARKARLLEVLDVDPTWRMHLVSDGQRRRVQLLLGLLHPFKVSPWACMCTGCCTGVVLCMRYSCALAC